MARELTRLNIPSSQDKIVLYDWMEIQDGRNLVRLNGSGALVWRAELQGIYPSDCYVQVRWVKDRLIANTYAGVETLIGLKDGSATSLRWLK